MVRHMRWAMALIAVAAASAAVMGGVASAKGEPVDEGGERGKPGGANAACIFTPRDYGAAQCWSRPGEPGAQGQAADY